MQDGAFHAGHELDHPGLADVLDEAVDDVVAQLAVGHLAAAEPKAGFDLVAFIEKADSLVLLGLVIVLVHGDGKFDFLYRNNLLLFAGGAFALFFFVKITAVVLDAADGRDSVGRNLNEIEAALAGDSQSFVGRQDSELDAVFIDDADFAGANAFVDADKRLGRTFVECDGAPPISGPSGVRKGLAAAGVRTLKSIALSRLRLNWAVSSITQRFAWRKQEIRQW